MAVREQDLERDSDVESDRDAGREAQLDSNRNKATETAAGDRLWSFATSLYAQPGVAATCLWLQDVHGVDVNIVLFSAWAATEGRVCGEADIADACLGCEDWRRAVVLPLREQRRRWKSSAQHSAEYAAIKTLELAAERRQLEFLAPRLFLLPAGELASTENATAPLFDATLNALGEHYQLAGDARQRLLSDLSSWHLPPTE